jgi:hypothetical protein
MGLFKFVRPRKQVTAMRATESGMSNPEFESMLANWGKPSAEHVKKMDEAYETHMNDYRAKRDSETAEKETRKKADDEAASLAIQRRPKPEYSDDSRMRYLGDD